MAANQRCKLAEETIATETRNVKELSKTVEDKFNEVSSKHILISPPSQIVIIASLNLSCYRMELFLPLPPPSPLVVTCVPLCTGSPLCCEEE